MVWPGSWNWAGSKNICRVFFPWSAFFVKGRPWSNSLSLHELFSCTPEGAAQHHRGTKQHNGLNIALLARAFLGNHDLSPPVWKHRPTLGQGARADQAKVTSFLGNSHLLLIQKEGGKKDQIWKHERRFLSLPSNGGKDLKAIFKKLFA